MVKLKEVRYVIVASCIISVLSLFISNIPVLNMLSYMIVGAAKIIYYLFRILATFLLFFSVWEELLSSKSLSERTDIVNTLIAISLGTEFIIQMPHILSRGIDEIYAIEYVNDLIAVSMCACAYILVLQKIEPFEDEELTIVHRTLYIVYIVICSFTNTGSSIPSIIYLVGYVVCMYRGIYDLSHIVVGMLAFVWEFMFNPAKATWSLISFGPAMLLAYIAMWSSNQERMVEPNEITRNNIRKKEMIVMCTVIPATYVIRYWFGWIV